ncbi:MAG: molybdenum cofactor biosynthesis protein [Solirubrobacteraceae bacterium]
MNVHVRLFAMLRERAGAGEVALELPDGASVAQALEALRWLTDGIPVVMAVNREYAEPTLMLARGDELALIPPVSGGSGPEASPPCAQTVHTRISSEPLSLERITAAVSDPRAGAVVTFLGVTREVPELGYEAYVEMAERKLAEIVAAAIERHGLTAAAAEHRIGTVPLSEPSVAVAVSAPHRAEAFAGAREIIDEIKAQAPIWKRELGEWVVGEPRYSAPPATGGAVGSAAPLDSSRVR